MADSVGGAAGRSHRTVRRRPKPDSARQRDAALDHMSPHGVYKGACTARQEPFRILPVQGNHRRIVGHEHRHRPSMPVLCRRNRLIRMGRAASHRAA